MLLPLTLGPTKMWLRWSAWKRFSLSLVYHQPGPVGDQVRVHERLSDGNGGGKSGVPRLHVLIG